MTIAQTRAARFRMAQLPKARRAAAVMKAARGDLRSLIGADISRHVAKAAKQGNIMKKVLGAIMLVACTFSASIAEASVQPNDSVIVAKENNFANPELCKQMVYTIIMFAQGREYVTLVPAHLTMLADACLDAEQRP